MSLRQLSTALLSPNPTTENTTMKLSYLLILPIAIMAAVSCTTITGETNTAVKAKPGVPGGEVVQTTTVNATVTGVDTTKRKVTLVTKDGKKFNVKAGPEVVNFDQIRVGDQLKATFTEEVVIRMAKPGEKIDDEIFGSIDTAPAGSKPSLKMSDTVQYSATITKIDTKRRKVTLSFDDGSKKKFPVRDDLDLSQRKVGEKVVFRSTEVYAISLKKP